MAISFVVSKSIENGVVPDHLKLAKVIPIYKAKDPCVLGITCRYLFYQLYLKFLKKSSISDFIIF